MFWVGKDIYKYNDPCKNLRTETAARHRIDVELVVQWIFLDFYH